MNKQQTPLDEHDDKDIEYVERLILQHHELLLIKAEAIKKYKFNSEEEHIIIDKFLKELLW